MHRLCRSRLGMVLWTLSCGLASAADGDEGSPRPSWLEPVERAWARVTDLEAWHGPGHWRLGVSPGMLHFRPSAEHTNVWAIGIERQVDDDWLAGASFFRNSYGQASAYAYIGHRSPGLLETPPLFFQWSAGLMYGYKGKYRDKVPLNVAGFAPGAVIGLGWQFDRQFSAAVHLLGDAGLMLQLAYDFR
jgi:hypothetical protein